MSVLNFSVADEIELETETERELNARYVVRSFTAQCHKRGSAVAEGPRDAPSLLKILSILDFIIIT